jgi:hypothetical protein
MRILKGLTGRYLPCGCLAGVYETYDGDIVGILDAWGPRCGDRAHEPGNTVLLDPEGAANDSPRRN